jgi:hypothetical protein
MLSYERFARSHPRLATSRSTWTSRSSSTKPTSLKLRTRTAAITLVTPYDETPLVRTPIESMTADFRFYASLYREAAGSNTPSYQFLCYHKILEGLRARHVRRIAEARERGEAIPPAPREYIPATRGEQEAWLAALFPLRQKWNDLAIAEIFPKSSIGRKINDVIDKELGELRNKIAHAVLRSGEPTVLIDDGADKSLILEWLPLAKCIARALLRTEYPDVFRRETGDVDGVDAR